MPDGTTHHNIWKVGWSISFPTSLYSVTFNPEFGIGVLVGYGIGRWIDPDWDIVGTTEAEGRMMNELKITGYVLYGISSIYGAIFRRFHRKWITHLPGLSTAIRMAFILLPIGLLWKGVFTFPVLLIGIWFGLSIADGLHYAADMYLGDAQKISKELFRKKPDKRSKINNKTIRKRKKFGG